MLLIFWHKALLPISYMISSQYGVVREIEGGRNEDRNHIGTILGKTLPVLRRNSLCNTAYFAVLQFIAPPRELRES